MAVVDSGKFTAGILGHMAFDFLKAEGAQDEEIVEAADAGDHDIRSLRSMAGHEVNNGLVDSLSL